MAQYQMYFGTQSGWTNFNVGVDEDEVLQSVLPDVLRELEENGYVLQGWHEGSGELVVTWEARELDLRAALPQQGVRPNEVLRVTVKAPKPVLQLCRDDEATTCATGRSCAKATTSSSGGASCGFTSPNTGKN
jgi:hypothetical protein